MKDEAKTKKQLVSELQTLREKITCLEASQSPPDQMAQTLRKSEERYRLLAENVNDVIWTMDETLNFTYVSPSIEKFSGYSPEETMKKGISGVLTPLSYEVAEKSFTESGSGEGPIDAIKLELEGLRKDGSTGWSEVNMTFILGAEGDFKGIVGVSRDITERKRAEMELIAHRDQLEEVVTGRTAELRKTNERLLREIEERKRVEQSLRENEERFRALFEGSLDAIFLADPESGEIIDANPMASELLLRPHEEILGLHFSKLHPAEVAKEVGEVFAVVVQDKQPARPLEGIVLCADGSTRDVEVLAQVIQIKGFPLIYGIFRDITERKQAQAAMKESEELYRTLVKTSPDAITVLDLKGRIMEVSDKTLEQYGFENADEALGKMHIDYVDVRDQRKEEERSRKLEEVGFLSNEEYCLRRKDGSSFFGEVNAAVIRDRQGHPKAYMAATRDITQRKLMEEEMLRTQKLESLGILAGGIAHDFNNLLTAIVTNISMAIMYGNLSQEISEMLADAETATLRAQRLTQQLLSFAKGGAPIRRICYLGRLIRDTGDFALSGSTAKCEYSLPHDLWLAYVDEGQVSQVIHNLVINGAQAMPEGGIIRISAENITFEKKDHPKLEEGDYVKISVTDEGVGIAEQDLTRIFDPFFSTKGQGSGLGLTSVFSILKSHEGHIEVDSKIGKGSTFHVFLPTNHEASGSDESEEMFP